MIESTREARMVDLFTTMADTLVDSYDVIELLQTLVDSCVDLFDVAAAGLLLADDRGELDVVASTSEASRLVEVMQVDAAEGPCTECFATGTVVSVEVIGEGDRPWPRYERCALDQGFRSVHAIPLRLRDTTIGALNLLRTSTGPLNARDVRAAQALADVATIGILHERVLQEAGLVQAQLQEALDTRVVIEQAKGVLAHQHGVSTEEAFQLLRRSARSTGTKLSELARDVVARRVRVPR
ncbi:GAF and ANTAR domain-containing protein [Frigoribacterium salinisoli]